LTEIDSFAVCRDGVAAGKYSILNVSVTFLAASGANIQESRPSQTFSRLLKIEQRKSKALN
jgi:hypothetical protein